MEGAVMEGPLFLQSQRFGTKVVCVCVCVWRGGWRNPSGLEVGEYPERGKGPEAGRNAARAIVEPHDVPLEAPGCSLLGAELGWHYLWESVPAWEATGSDRPARGSLLPRGARAAAHYRVCRFFPEVEENLGCALPG